MTYLIPGDHNLNQLKISLPEDSSTLELVSLFSLFLLDFERFFAIYSCIKLYPHPICGLILSPGIRILTNWNLHYLRILLTSTAFLINCFWSRRHLKIYFFAKNCPSPLWPHPTPQDLLSTLAENFPHKLQLSQALGF